MKTEFKRRIKKIYYSGPLRATVLELDKEDPNYSEDTFEVLGEPWLVDGSKVYPILDHLSNENKRVLKTLKRDKKGNLLAKTNIVEFRFGTYEVKSLHDRVKPKVVNSKDFSNYVEIPLNLPNL